MATIHLRPITEDNWQTCVNLVVAPDQTEFVAPNTHSLAQAAHQRHRALIPLGVHADPDSPPDSQGRHCNFRFMIGQTCQDQVYGRATMAALLARMRATVPADRPIALDYHERKVLAARLYQHFGVVPTGERDGSEIIAALLIAAGA